MISQDKCSSLGCVFVAFLKFKHWMIKDEKKKSESKRFTQCWWGFEVRRSLLPLFFLLLGTTVPSEMFMFKAALQELFSIETCCFGFHIRRKLLYSRSKVIFDNKLTFYCLTGLNGYCPWYICPCWKWSQARHQLGKQWQSAANTLLWTLFCWLITLFCWSWNTITTYVQNLPWPKSAACCACIAHTEQAPFCSKIIIQV